MKRVILTAMIIAVLVGGMMGTNFYKYHQREVQIEELRKDLRDLQESQRENQKSQKENRKILEDATRLSRESEQILEEVCANLKKSADMSDLCTHR